VRAVARVADSTKDWSARIVTGLHKAVFRASKGRVLGRTLGMPVLELTTIGRRSGKRRKTMLTSPVQDDDRIVLVASYGGDDRHPTWFLNLRDHTAVEVTMGGTKRSMQARVASPEEKAELWPRVVDAYRGYGRYQGKTDRDIPLVILS
jgi:deazaflavin-dependent oxidoreductase (nitroreductase family)